MFEDFDPKNQSKDKRRMGVSLVVSGVVCVGLASAAIAASAAARHAVREEELVQVEFAAPPEPEPPPAEPPPPPPPAATPPAPRPKTARKELAPPKEIPNEKPPEADKPLAEAPPPGAGQDGFTDGVVGGTGTAPAPVAVPAPAPAAPRADAPVQLPENASPVVAKSGNAMPAYPEEARRAGVQGAVIAKLVVGNDGSVKSVQILRGPEVFHAVVKATLMTWRFEPARLPDGTAITVFKLVSLPFKLDNM